MFRFLTLIAFLTILPSLHAKEEVILLHGTEKLNLSKSVYFFEDKKNELKIETVLNNPELQNQFIRNESNILNFAYSTSTYWLRLDLQNLDFETKDWLLEIGNSHLDIIEFYYKKNNSWQKKVYGDILPFAQREIFSRFFVIPLDLSPGESFQIFFKIKTSTVVIIPVTLYRTTSYLNSTMKLESWYAFFYGSMVVMILYNGFIFLAFRSKSYLLYCLSTFFTLLFYLSFNGHGFQYLWQKSTWWQNIAVPVFTGIGWIFIHSFTSQFLELKKKYKYLRFISITLQIFYICSLIAIFNSVLVSVIIESFITILSVLFVFFAGIFSLIKGNKSARFFVIAWFTFLSGVILFILYTLNLIEHNFFTEQTIQIGTLAELILISFALSDRYHNIQNTNIKIHKELLDTQRRINETLEEKVTARTAELNASLHMIKDDLSMAQKIQSLTLSSNLNQNEKLEIIVKYNAMSEVGGDYYSVDKLDDSIVRIFLADATGHGVQAALIMMAIQGIYDTLKYFALPANEIMEIFNKEFIRRYGAIKSYLTCILVDVDTQKHTLSYSSAGHPDGLLIHQGKDFQLLKNTGGLIGINRINTYTCLEFPFIETDRLFIFTDGIFEQFIGEKEFGEDRLYNILIQNKSNNINYSLDQVLSELEIFLGNTGKQDDITLIGIGYKILF